MRDSACAGPALALMIVLAMLLPTSAIAQKYADRPVRVVNTFPAGGAGDTMRRIVFEKVGNALSQPLLVDTRSGAAGSLGTSNIATSAAGGYSLVLGTASTFDANSATQKNLPYDPVRDFTRVVMPPPRRTCP